MEILNSKIFTGIIFAVLVIVGILMSFFYYPRLKKIVELLKNKYSKIYNPKLSNIYLLNIKLFFNPSSFPEEIQEIYKPIRIIGILIYSLLAIIILLTIWYIISVI